MKTQPVIEIGAVFQFSYPFCRETLSTYDEGGMSESATWRPGTKDVINDRGDDTYLVAHGIGQQILTVVGKYRPDRFPERIFYTRKWRDPSGKVFGKNSCRVSTTGSFRGLTRGYRHHFELQEPEPVSSPKVEVLVGGDR